MTYFNPGLVKFKEIQVVFTVSTFVSDPESTLYSVMYPNYITMYPVSSILYPLSPILYAVSLHVPCAVCPVYCINMCAVYRILYL